MQLLIDTSAKTLTIKGTVSLDELFTFLTDKVKDWPDWMLQSEEPKYKFDHLWRDTTSPFVVTRGTDASAPYKDFSKITTTEYPIWTTEGCNITYTKK